jgi:hypothetical protein
MIFVFCIIIIGLIFCNNYSKGKVETEKTLVTLENKKLDNLRRNPRLNTNYEKVISVLNTLSNKYSSHKLAPNQFYFQKTRDESNRVFGQGYIGDSKHLTIDFNISPNYILYSLKISKNHEVVFSVNENFKGQNIPNSEDIVQKIIQNIEQLN